jgi:hypothetical protein
MENNVLRTPYPITAVSMPFPTGMFAENYDFNVQFEWFEARREASLDHILQYLGFQPQDKDSVDKMMRALDAGVKWLASNASQVPISAEIVAQNQIKIKKVFDLATGFDHPIDSIDVPTHVLSGETFSFAYDLQLIFGQILILNNPKLKWTVWLPKRSDADKGEVVVGTLRKRQFPFVNCWRICNVIGERYASGEASLEKTWYALNTWIDKMKP